MFLVGTFCTVFFLGAALFRVSAIVPADHIKNYTASRGQDVILRGIVVSDPVKKKGKLSFVMDAEYLEMFGRTYKVKGKVLVWCFLIKNISFRPSIIPLIKILTNSLIHLIFILILTIVAITYDYPPSLHWVQVIYYMFCSIMLALGISWFSCSFLARCLTSMPC